MLNSIKNFLLKKFYRLLIYKVIILPKKDIAIYEKLDTYLKININSNKGVFTFNFKKDRRTDRKKIDVLTKCFVVELEVPSNLKVRNSDIIDKVLVVIKIAFSPVNYELLSEILMELYLDNFLKKYQ